MASWAELGTGARASIGGVVAIVAAMAGYGVWQTSQPPAPSMPVALTEAVPAAAATPKVTAEAVLPPSDLADVAPAAAPPAEIAAVDPAPPETAPQPPSFDVVRIEPDGASLVAGTASPGATILLRLDGVEVAKLLAGPDGKFAALFSLGASATPRMLTMTMLTAEGATIDAPDRVAVAPTAAPQVVALLEPAPPEPAPAAPAPAAPAPAALAPAALAPAEPAAPDVTLESAPETAASQAIAAETVPQTVPETVPEPAAALLVSPEGVTVLQPDGEAPVGTAGTVSLDSIAYTADGAVALGGTGTPGQTVQLYLNNTQIASVAVPAGGNWSVTMSTIAPGLYTLRADEVDAGGTVTSRIETPFKRETLEALAAALGAPAEAPAAELVAALEMAAETPVGEAASTEVAPDAVAPDAVAPVAVAPVAVTPAETVTTESVPEAAPPEPAVSEPPATEPAATEPAATEPASAVAETAPVVAVPTAPEVADPVAVDPAPAEDAVPETAQTDTALSEPVAELVIAAPAATEPVAAPVQTAEPPPDVAAAPVVPKPAADPAATPPAAPLTITVQPGYTLWGIARDNMGEGVMYVQVYKANRDKIRNPDLIYPGQVFMMPAE